MDKPHDMPMQYLQQGKRVDLIYYHSYIINIPRKRGRTCLVRLRPL
jgi:hypothetical protein